MKKEKEAKVEVDILGNVIWTCECGKSMFLNSWFTPEIHKLVEKGAFKEDYITRLIDKDLAQQRKSHPLDKEKTL